MSISQLAQYLLLGLGPSLLGLGPSLLGLGPSLLGLGPSLLGLGPSLLGLLAALLVGPTPNSSLATLAFFVVFKVLIKLFFAMDIV